MFIILLVFDILVLLLMGYLDEIEVERLSSIGFFFKYNCSVVLLLGFFILEVFFIYSLKLYNYFVFLKKRNKIK